MKVMERVGILANLRKRNASQVIEEIAHWLEEEGVKVFLSQEIAQKICREELGLKEEELPSNIDLLIALGGDGTLLHAARLIGDKGVPLLGVNLGSLGFLTETTSEEVLEVLENIRNRKYEVEKRMVLETTVRREGEEKGKFFALNEAVIARGNISRILKLRTYVDGEYLTTYASDGLIISTPTGSTAHSLAAGGPILYPLLDSFVLTPICPHTLSNRPLILSSKSLIQVDLLSPHRVMLTMDGQVTFELHPRDRVEVKSASHHLQLITSPRKHFAILRKKLGWGGQSASIEGKE